MSFRLGAAAGPLQESGLLHQGQRRMTEGVVDTSGAQRPGAEVEVYLVLYTLLYILYRHGSCVYSIKSVNMTARHICTVTLLYCILQL